MYVITDKLKQSGSIHVLKKSPSPGARGDRNSPRMAFKQNILLKSTISTHKLAFQYSTFVLKLPSGNVHMEYKMCTLHAQ